VSAYLSIALKTDIHLNDVHILRAYLTENILATFVM